MRWMPRLIWVFAERTCHLVGFVMRQLKSWKLNLQPELHGQNSSNYHTCHFSHCEIKSRRIWPIWKPVPITHNFQTILEHILWRNKHKSYIIVFITSLLHLNKSFWLFWGSSKVIFVKISQNFIKSPWKICHISQIVHSLWHIWIELHHEKTCFSHMCTTKVQISLRIHAVCSAPLLCDTCCDSIIPLVSISKISRL